MISNKIQNSNENDTCKAHLIHRLMNHIHSMTHDQTLFKFTVKYHHHNVAPKATSLNGQAVFYSRLQSIYHIVSVQTSLQENQSLDSLLV